jgi:predicted nucleic acid-binding protein
MSIIHAPPETPLVIDTNIFSHLRNGNELVKNEIAKYFSNTKSFPAISSMTVFEANYGIYSQLAQQNIDLEKANEFHQNVNNTLSKISKILPFDQRASEIAAYIYAHLLVNESKWLQKRKSKKKKGNREAKIWQDVFIISTALSHNYGLASPDTDIEVIAKYLPPNIDLRFAVWKQ